MYENTRPNEPILFITTPGTDPSPELRELANKDIGINNYIEVCIPDKETNSINRFQWGKGRENTQLSLYLNHGKLVSG